MTEATLSIREMCEAFDVTPRALRFYEAKELLTPIRRGTRRLYTRRERARLTLILRGKRFGFSLEEIRQLLDLYREGQTRQMEESLAVAGRHMEEMEARRRALDEAMAELGSQMDFVRAELSRAQGAQQGAHQGAQGSAGAAA